MCEREFQYTSGTERGILQMLNEGYYDIIKKGINGSKSKNKHSK